MTLYLTYIIIKHYISIWQTLGGKDIYKCYLWGKYELTSTKEMMIYVQYENNMLQKKYIINDKLWNCIMLY